MRWKHDEKFFEVDSYNNTYFNLGKSIVKSIGNSSGYFSFLVKLSFFSNLFESICYKKNPKIQNRIRHEVAAAADHLFIYVRYHLINQNGK